MEIKNIRNFCIIAHIDHGKSTLADRLLEFTGTIEKRKMREQFLDQMELERERGITIKMQPVRMNYKLQTIDYILNLIDTPGHIDFNYEVSRALKAVEAAILLVDATQGVEAQTITNVEMAKEMGLVILPVINKIDLPMARLQETKDEIIKLLKCKKENILSISAKTGEGVEKLLEEIVKGVPPPQYEYEGKLRALVFDFEYSLHQGVIFYVRLMDGSMKKGDELLLFQGGEKFIAGEVGIFLPNRHPLPVLNKGEIGYIISNIKKTSIAVVGDSIFSVKTILPPLAGYLKPKPVVWASIYPSTADDFTNLRQALDRLRLSDNSINYEEEASDVLGKGFRCGFLGMLHLEIVVERLKREFNLNLVVTNPTISYKIKFINGEEKEIYSPAFFPDDHLIKKIFEPWVETQIIIPPEKIGPVMQLLYDRQAEIGETEQFGDWRVLLKAKMPLRELMRNFFDELKSLTAGYCSLNYKFLEPKEIEPGELTRLDIFVADSLIPAFSRVVLRERIEAEAEEAVEKLKNLIPRALFVIKIQAKGRGRILASRSISALKKDVTGYLYGGDRTRKMKLWQKQKRGKKKLKEMGRVNIPQEVFVKMIQK